MYMLNVLPIRAFTDNYIWLIQTNEGNTLVDPGDSDPVKEVINDLNIEIDDILITHHHFDHTGGLNDLKKSIKGKVIGPHNKNIPQIDLRVKEGDAINSVGLNFKVINVPGHTLDHIAFFCKESVEPILFCGDTVFSGGCGRVFEGTFSQMHESLNKIASLPKNTLIYCAHEYTLSNLNFAMEVEPLNYDIKNYYESCSKKLSSNVPTIPTTLKKELSINPFLRSSTYELRESISNNFSNVNDVPDHKVFEYVRKWKDSL